MKLLFVLPRSPWPPYVGQSRLAYFRAQELRRLGHEVHLFCYGLGVHRITLEQRNLLSLAYNSVVCINLSRLDLLLGVILRCPGLFFSGRSFLAYGFTPPSLCVRFKEYLKSMRFDFVHFYSIRSCPLWPLISFFHIPCVVDLVDSMSLNFAKRVDNCRSVLKPLLRLEYFRLRSFESNLPNSSLCRSYLVVAESDLSCLSVARASLDSIQSASGRPDLQLCPIGVKPFDHVPKVDDISSDTPRIAFFGSLSYTPNIEALEWFIDNVYPIVAGSIPDIEFLILGSNPSDSVVAYASKYSSIRLIANPASIAPYLCASFASVAPMVSGSGQQFKIIESLANKIPCVSTSLAADALSLKNDEHLCVANSPTEFASKILLLYQNSRLASRIARLGCEYVMSRYSWKSSAEKLIGIYRQPA
jgi:glycosyltransferase involved in cell wall biosynthesis